MKVNIQLIIGQFVVFFILFTLALFLPADTIIWPAGWTFLLMFFSFFLAINIWLLKNNPALLQERKSMVRLGQKGWDKVIFPILIISPFVLLGIAGFDAVRFHWSSMPIWLQGTGVIFLLISFYLFFLTFRENSFLSTVVRIQGEREHSVVSTGPYRHVRHPMYAGFLAFVAGTPLLLGSWYGLLFGLLFMILLGRRAVLEERMLRDELPGYADYMVNVRYRFIPYLW